MDFSVMYLQRSEDIGPHAVDMDVELVLGSTVPRVDQAHLALPGAHVADVTSFPALDGARTRVSCSAVSKGPASLEAPRL